jgi:hypothetical protein
VPEVGGEGVEELAEYLAQLSERQAANARALFQRIERRRRELREQGRNFSARTGAQVLERLQSAHSPMFDVVGWNDTTSPGMINLDVGVFNPDPVAQYALFVHVFMGPADLATDVGQALSLVDTRFPRLTEPIFDGLRLDPGTGAALYFSIKVPTGIEPSNYLGNVFLFGAQFFGSDELFDRALFVFNIS